MSRMVALDYEGIAEALRRRLHDKLVAPNGPITFVNRRLRPWDDSSAAEQPCLYIEQRGMQVTQLSQSGHFSLSKYTIEYMLWVYLRIDSQPGSIPSTQINQVYGAISQALKPDLEGNWLTLGLPDMITHCWIEGRVEIIESLDDQQSVMLIPVYIATGDY